MLNRKTKQPVIDKFRQLSLHTRTIDYLHSLNSELKNHHYNDLIKLNSIETVRNLSEDDQLIFMKSIIENRRKIHINNKIALAEILLGQTPCNISAELWRDLLLSKVNELDQLYNYTKQAIKGLNKKEKDKLVSALKLHSIKNLESIILLKESTSKHNT